MGFTDNDTGILLCEITWIGIGPKIESGTVFEYLKSEQPGKTLNASLHT
jgi:hypothetical protein